MVSCTHTSTTLGPDAKNTLKKGISHNVFHSSTRDYKVFFYSRRMIPVTQSRSRGHSKGRAGVLHSLTALPLIKCLHSFSLPASPRRPMFLTASNYFCWESLLWLLSSHSRPHLSESLPRVGFSPRDTQDHTYRIFKLLP